MAKPIELNIPHSVGKDEARRRIEQGFGNLQTHMAGGLGALISFQQRWTSDLMEFEGGALGQKMRGRIEALPDSIRIQVDLPDVLAAIAERIKDSLKKEAQKLLEKK